MSIGILMLSLQRGKMSRVGYFAYLIYILRGEEMNKNK